MRKLLPALALTGVFATPAAAAAGTLNLTVQVPQLTVAEYHRPYVAIWIQRADQTAAGTLAVWYDVKNKKASESGETWLKDLRQWWRRTGRDQTAFDGLSGATRAPGPQTLSFTSASGPLANLPAGQYALVVEAAREVGSHELVKVSFAWPPKSAQTTTGQGEAELGAVTLTAKP
jgi:hypothetical protein